MVLRFLLILSLSSLVFSETSAQVLKGQASFYNDKLHGRETASGEKYDKFALTAAHKTLPFGTKVKVTNLWNGKSVVVKVNDRGPFKEGRIIDVSKAAAIELQMIDAGVVDVRVDVLGKEEPKSSTSPKTNTKTNDLPKGDGTYQFQARKLQPTGYGVQIASFAEFYNLLGLIEKLTDEGIKDIFINTDQIKGKRVFRIIVGNFEKKAQAELYLVSLKSKGYKGFLFSHTS